MPRRGLRPTVPQTARPCRRSAAPLRVDVGTVRDRRAILPTVRCPKQQQQRPLRRAAVSALVAASSLSLVSCDPDSKPESAPIDSVTTSEDGRKLVATWVGGECDKLETVNVQADEGRSRVTLRVSVEVEGGDCPAVAVYRDVEVSLTDPLGSRTLIDGASGATIPPCRPGYRPIRPSCDLPG
jgi:hypothetical protein